MYRKIRSISFVVAGVALMTSCGLIGGGGKTDESPKTGWKYNNPDMGGFEVRQAVEQITGPGLVFIEGGTFTQGRVEQDVKSKDDPFSAVLLGVDDPWEVCLLKLMVELVQHSASENIQDIQKLAQSHQKTLNQRIDQAFLDASRDPSRINDLADMLKKNGLWKQNEDRFFALVKASGQ